MILNDNICTQIGDSIFFESTPIWGSLREFSSFSEEIDGETSDRYFKKIFRYSYDGGIIYCDWLELNQDNISNIFNAWLSENNNNLSPRLDAQSELKFQFKYERVGTDNTGELTLNSLSLNGSFLPREFEFKSINNSIFSDIINDNIDLFDLTMNLVNKMYEVGIVPNYIERKEEDKSNLLEDRDYIDLWKTTSEFYAMIFLYALRFTNIYWKKDLICEYLQQNGIFLCECRDIIEMQNISRNFYDEIRSRGTTEIFKPKGFEYMIGDRYIYEAPIDCEITPSTPVIIDGVSYSESHELPFGWVFKYSSTSNSLLYSNDMNYHDITFIVKNILNENILYSPISKYKALSTSTSEIFKQYNGEYLRLICYSNKCDEFIYNIVNIKDFGWNIYNSSPLYKGLDDQYGTIVKAYESVKDFTDLTKYPWFSEVLISEDIIKTDYCIPIMISSSLVVDEICYPIQIISSTVYPLQ